MSYNHGIRTVYGLNCKKIGNPFVRYGRGVRRLDCGLHYMDEQPTIYITDNSRLAKSMATKKDAELVEYVLVPKDAYVNLQKLADSTRSHPNYPETELKTCPKCGCCDAKFYQDCTR